MSRPTNDGNQKDLSVVALTPLLSSAGGGPGGLSPSRFVPGATFAGRYRMIALLGRGGMGEVWQAEDLVLQTPVALKVIDATDQRSRERILKEVRLARQVT